MRASRIFRSSFMQVRFQFGFGIGVQELERK
jgi:hypothetical protein